MRRKPSILVGSIILFLLAYHAYNAFTVGLFRLDLDKSAAWLKRIGYLARFKAGEDSEVILRIPNTSPLSLFRRRDLIYFDANYASRLTKNFVPRVQNFVEELTREGVEVVLLPVPPKVAVEYKRLPKPLPPHGLYEYLGPRPVPNPRLSYQPFIDGNPERAVDLLTLYETHFAKNAEPVFLPWDFHWNSLGIALAAKGVLDHLRSQGHSLGRFSIEPYGELQANQGNFLINHYRLPDFYHRQALEMNPTERIYHLVESPISRKRTPSEKRLIIAGTSFCARWQESEHGLGLTLASALGRKLVSYCYLGGGLKGAWDQMRERGFHFEKGDLLVWEILMPPDLSEELNYLRLPGIS